MNMIKPFDKDLYDKSDPPAKKAMIEWLSLNGYVNIDDKETKSFDLVCNKVDHDISTIEPRKYFYEVEIKFPWKGKWPEHWKDVRIPFRKERLIKRWQEEFSNDKLTFVVFRNDCKQAWHIAGQTVAESKVKKAYGPKTGNEDYFHINVEDAELVDM